MRVGQLFNKSPSGRAESRLFICGLTFIDPTRPIEISVIHQSGSLFLTYIRLTIIIIVCKIIQLNNFKPNILLFL